MLLTANTRVEMLAICAKTARIERCFPLAARNPTMALTSSRGLASPDPDPQRRIAILMLARTSHGARLIQIPSAIDDRFAGGDAELLADLMPLALMRRYVIRFPKPRRHAEG